MVHCLDMSISSPERMTTQIYITALALQHSQNVSRELQTVSNKTTVKCINDSVVSNVVSQHDVTTAGLSNTINNHNQQTHL